MAVERIKLDQCSQVMAGAALSDSRSHFLCGLPPSPGKALCLPHFLFTSHTIGLHCSVCLLARLPLSLLFYHKPESKPHEIILSCFFPLTSLVSYTQNCFKIISPKLQIKTTRQWRILTSTLILIFLSCVLWVWVFSLHECVSVHHSHMWCLYRSEEGVGCAEIGVTHSCKTLCETGT